MSKVELIEYIREINKSASPEFLEMFDEQDLSEYLENLMKLNLKELAVCS